MNTPKMCENCKVKPVTPTREKYCSSLCARQMSAKLDKERRHPTTHPKKMKPKNHKREAICLNCKVNPVPLGKRKYCSDECLLEANVQQQRDRKADKQRQKKCEQCKTPLPPGMKKYCSHSCFRVARSQKYNYPGRQGKFTHCQNPECVNPLPKKAKKYCSKKCRKRVEHLKRTGQTGKIAKPVFIPH